MDKLRLYDILYLETGGNISLSKEEYVYLSRLSLEKQKEALEVEVYYTVINSDNEKLLESKVMKYCTVYSFNEFMNKYYMNIDSLMLLDGTITGVKYSNKYFAGHSQNAFINSLHLVDITRSIEGGCNVIKYYYAKVVFKR